MSGSETHYLFGGDGPWSPNDWTSCDDRVRGGSSYSVLTCSDIPPWVAQFQGHLDIHTLGGAGFASQQTTGGGDDRSWDLSAYDGLWIEVDRSDGKRYTVILKDEVLSKRPDGRERSTVSWEYGFRIDDDDDDDKAATPSKEVVFAKWVDLKATYRGREIKDAKPLDLKHVRRISIMMRSFFGTQEGDFTLSLASIAAAKIGAAPDDQREERIAIEERGGNYESNSRAS